MKKKYIKPTSTVYQVGLRKEACEDILMTSAYNENSRQAIQQNPWDDDSENDFFNPINSQTNIWDEW